MKNAKVGFSSIVVFLTTCPDCENNKVLNGEAFNLPWQYEPSGHQFTLEKPWVKWGYDGKYTYFDGENYHKERLSEDDGNAVIEKMLEWGFHKYNPNPEQNLKCNIATQLLELADEDAIRRKMRLNISLVNWLQDYILVEMDVLRSGLLWSDDHSGVDTYTTGIEKEYVVFITERRYRGKLCERLVRHVSKEWIKAADEKAVIDALKDWHYQKVTKITFCSDGQIRESEGCYEKSRA